MIAVADSGSTKTSWYFVNEQGQGFEYKTVGFNPYYQNSEDILNNLREGLIPNLEFSEPVKEIYFYGAGCELPSKRAEVENPLKKAFPDAKVVVGHDMLGAAKALLGSQAGIACISGTGSNSCYYDGTDVTENVRSLGLYMGDEGSGGYIGRSLIIAYLREELPTEIRTNI